MADECVLGGKGKGEEMGVWRYLVSCVLASKIELGWAGHEGDKDQISGWVESKGMRSGNGGGWVDCRAPRPEHSNKKESPIKPCPCTYQRSTKRPRPRPPTASARAAASWSCAWALGGGGGHGSPTSTCFELPRGGTCQPWGAASNAGLLSQHAVDAGPAWRPRQKRQPFAWCSLCWCAFGGQA